jgi:hypothetical protein
MKDAIGLTIGGTVKGDVVKVRFGNSRSRHSLLTPCFARK